MSTKLCDLEISLNLKEFLYYGEINGVKSNIIFQIFLRSRGPYKNAYKTRHF